MKLLKRIKGDNESEAKLIAESENRSELEDKGTKLAKEEGSEITVWKARYPVMGDNRLNASNNRRMKYKTHSGQEVILDIE